MTAKNYPGNFASGADAEAAANALCKTAADASGLTAGRKWHAWISTGASNAIDGLLGVKGPWKELDGKVVFKSASDIANGNFPQSPIDVDETGVVVPAGNAWTATDGFGKLLAPHCNSWKSTAAKGTVGVPGSTSLWTASTPKACTGVAHLYCFEK